MGCAGQCVIYYLLNARDQSAGNHSGDREPILHQYPRVLQVEAVQLRLAALELLPRDHDLLGAAPSVHDNVLWGLQ
jgi:hypothetical protein